MGVNAYSTDPSANTAISGINIGEGCPPGNINDAIRQLMADIMADRVPSGTAMLFCQATAPTGWTKSTTHNDKALRIVNGTSGGSAGGSIAFSAVFGRTASDAGGGGGTYGTTLDGNTLPSHNHHLSSWSLAMNQNGGNDFFFPASSHDYDNWDNSSDHITYAGGSAAHSHGTPTHTHGMDLRVQYVDSIIATKD